MVLFAVVRLDNRDERPFRVLTWHGRFMAHERDVEHPQSATGGAHGASITPIEHTNVGHWTPVHVVLRSICNQPPRKSMREIAPVRICDPTMYPLGQSSDSAICSSGGSTPHSSSSGDVPICIGMR